MKRYRERFLTVSDFISHCRELNIRVSKEELEHYEKIRVMLPIVRLTYPAEFVVERTRTQWGLSGSSDVVDISRWPGLERLQEMLSLFPFPGGFACLTDEELVHSLDREIDANLYLTRPSADTFRAWNEYKVQIPDIHEGQLTASTAEHYYSYWQVHQLHHIQKFPDIYKYRNLFECVREHTDLNLYSPSPSPEYLADFKGMRRYFDALSFWLTVSLRERGRTFATVKEVDGIRTLSDSDADDFKDRLEALAGTVLSRFNLCSDDLYKFLRQLIRLYEDYRKDERYKLADELKSDMWHLSNLIELTVGVTREQVEGKLSHYDSITFRHLNEVLKERDYAARVLGRVVSKCASDLQNLGVNWSFTEAEINDLLDYCEQEGIGLLCTALSGMVAIEDEEYHQKFRRVTRYTNLKSILSSYEYFLKSFDSKANLGIGGKTLTRSIDSVMGNENWYPLFNSQRTDANNKSLLYAEDTTEFINNLVTIWNDSQLKNSEEGHCAQAFLLTLSARNGTVHFYPDEDKYYGDMFGPMLNAPIIATFYTWKLAKQKGWV